MELEKITLLMIRFFNSIMVQGIFVSVSFVSVFCEFCIDTKFAYNDDNLITQFDKYKICIRSRFVNIKYNSLVWCDIITKAIHIRQFYALIVII